MRERKLNRLKNYDYSQSGGYFVTICVRAMTPYFGKISDGRLWLNDFGQLAKRLWQEIPRHYQNVTIDQFVVMPNHIHGIILINSANDIGTEHLVVGTERLVGTEQCSVLTGNNKYSGPPCSRNYGLLSKIIKSFKNEFTKRVRREYQDQRFRWQRSFYDHIIRDADSCKRIRQYIMNNPLKWNLDIENQPVGKKSGMLG